MAGSIKALDYVSIVCFSSILVVGFIGNFLVLYAFLFVKISSSISDDILTPMELVICYLAFIDMLTSIFNPMIYIYFTANPDSWIFGQELCVIGPGFMSVFSTMSFGMILVITIERCIVICFPFRRRLRKKEIHFAFLAVFIVSTLNELPYLLTLKIIPTKIEGKYRCKIVSNAANISNIIRKGSRICFNNGTLFATEDIFVTEDIFAIANQTTTECEKLPSLSNISELKCCDHQENETMYKHDSGSFRASCELQSCRVSGKSCYPGNTNKYRYQRIGTIMLRDIVFLTVFTVSIYLIYKQLKLNNDMLKGQGNLEPNRYLRILLTMAVVFGVLVFPKDIFHITHAFHVSLDKPSLDDKVSGVVNTSLKILQSLTCVANVFIYAKLHTKFKTRIHHISSNISKTVVSKRYSYLKKDLTSSVIGRLDEMKETDV